MKTDQRSSHRESRQKPICRSQKPQDRQKDEAKGMVCVCAAQLYTLEQPQGHNKDKTPI